MFIHLNEYFLLRLTTSERNCLRMIKPPKRIECHMSIFICYFCLQLSTISNENGGAEVRVEGIPRQTSTFWATALLVAAYAAIFALGLIGNSLVILTLTRNKRVKVCSNESLYVFHLLFSCLPSKWYWNEYAHLNE